MIPAAEVRRVLDLLGTNHREVAATLAAKGIRGTHATSTCPISRYVAEQFPGMRVTTGNWFVILVDPVHATDYELPFPVLAFVTHFDGGEYPELEQESA